MTVSQKRKEKKRKVILDLLTHNLANISLVNDNKSF